ncbi:MAG: response regulator [Thermoflexales bacterium]|nr:response regulator [Thermoflexales bacterium]
MAKKKRILIVDDDSDFALAVRMVLEGEGYLVEEARSGDEGLEKMRALLPDLVLMDVMMANPLDGYYTTQAIADDPKLRNTPILMVSSIADTPYVSSFPTDQYLMAEFVFKPIEPEALLTKIEQRLKPKSRRRKGSA